MKSIRKNSAAGMRKAGGPASAAKGPRQNDDERGAGGERGQGAEAEDGEEILGEVADEVARSFDPAEADETGAESDSLAISRAFDLDAKAEVFDDLHAKRLETADGAVDIGTNRG